jgi:hypothetical protein
MPERIRLSRARGWRLPDNAVNCARPGPFGNPFVVSLDGTREDVVRWFRLIMQGCRVVHSNVTFEDQDAAQARILARLPELRGKDLACWCRLDGKPCHADVLLELANR